ncbi:MAG: hypothetical protein M1840_005481 [Geoglossum simile]|nr:MAG: hypothetical protein M1840_005481 [Geoglossum simile]
MTTPASTSTTESLQQSPRSSVDPVCVSHAITSTNSPPRLSAISRTPSSKSVQFSLVPSSSSLARPRSSSSMLKSRSIRERERPISTTATTQDDAAASASSADEMTAIVCGGSGRGKRDYLGVGGGSPTAPAATPAAATTAASTGADSEAVKAGADHHSEGWFKRFVDKYGSVELDNKGSVARDHLALERTFLAWLRTSLAFASIGVAITQLFRLNTTLAGDTSQPPGAQHLRQVGKPLGATFLAIAIVVLFIGFQRYFESQYWIIKGKFPASRGGVAVVTVVAGLLIVVSLVVVLAVGGRAFEK